MEVWRGICVLGIHIDLVENRIGLVGNSIYTSCCKHASNSNSVGIRVGLRAYRRIFHKSRIRKIKENENEEKEGRMGAT